ncbi:hypothetical protein CEUSTIGMA_g4440.t1 [Chlamydomonas eustigma]|uniref:Uncharacterized protein n=1 Tax=Chlamydomonas eustigma TaxID=1157962 RepID=A0A250X1M9_9CHLO|nr:hypothetical protein CEUSTIGMA_g4440.t1 [Chlamydomonas eustigma]|eukprot:GAX76993.1 hypothetical protein CEUSTIGMA_g4440.t1 [Chlamydomonas eustigma]
MMYLPSYRTTNMIACERFNLSETMAADTSQRPTHTFKSLRVSTISSQNVTSTPNSPQSDVHRGRSPTRRPLSVSGGDSPARPTQWYPSPYHATAPGLKDTIFMRTRGTGPVWTATGVHAQSPASSKPDARFSLKSALSAPAGSLSPDYNPNVLNGNLSLHQMAKISGNASPSRPVRSAISNNDIPMCCFVTQPLQRGGISSFGYK